MEQSRSGLALSCSNEVGFGYLLFWLLDVCQLQTGFQLQPCFSLYLELFISLYMENDNMIVWFLSLHWGRVAGFVLVVASTLGRAVFAISWELRVKAPGGTSKAIACI